MNSHPVDRRKVLSSVKNRALVVAITASSLAFVGSAYWHYRTHAATDYQCVEVNGSLLASPVESQRYMLYDTHLYNSFYFIDRHFIEGAVVHIPKSYLEDKYPHRSSYIEADKELAKQERNSYNAELALLKQDIMKYYEARYIEEAVGFALMWSVLLPLSSAALLYFFFAIKNFILYGEFRAFRSSEAGSR